MKVKVTQEHIDNGKRGSFSSCPVALALKDVPNVLDPTVSRANIFFTRHIAEGVAHRERYITPAACEAFIAAYDNSFRRADECPGPFEFELKLPFAIAG